MAYCKVDKCDFWLYILLTFILALFIGHFWGWYVYKGYPCQVEYIRGMQSTLSEMDDAYETSIRTGGTYYWAGKKWTPWKHPKGVFVTEDRRGENVD